MDRQEPMSDDDYEDTINRINTLRVSELKTLCRATGRLVSGRKADLAERLKLFFQLGKDNHDNVLLLAMRTLVLKAANFQEVPNFDTIYNALKTNSHLVMLSSAGPNTVAAAQPAVAHTQLPTTAGTTMFQGVNTFPTKTYEDPRKVRPWVYFQESPFYRLKRLVHGTPVMAEKAPGRRGQCNIQFILNESENKTLFGKSNYKLLLLSGSYDGHNVTNNAFVEFPQPLEIYCNKIPVKDNVKGIKNKPGTARPANLTPFVKEPPTMNNLQVVYAFSNTDYLFYLYIVESFSAFDVLQRVLAQPHIIKEATLNSFSKTEEDDDVVEMSQVLSLKCPLSFSRMKYPCKSIYCEHIQCFDGLAFLQLQEQASTWSCPICSKPIEVKDLALSDYVVEILENTTDLVETVEIDPNGNWTIGKEDEPDNTQSHEKSNEGMKYEPTEEVLPPADASVEVISLDSDSEGEGEGFSINPMQPVNANATVLPQNVVSASVDVSDTTNNDRQFSSSASIPPTGEETLDDSDLPTVSTRRGLPRIDSEREDTATSTSSSPLPPPPNPPNQSMSNESQVARTTPTVSEARLQPNGNLTNLELQNEPEKSDGTEAGNRRRRSISPLPPPSIPPPVSLPHLNSLPLDPQLQNNMNIAATPSTGNNHSMGTTSLTPLETSQRQVQGNYSASFPTASVHRSISDSQGVQYHQIPNSRSFNGVPSRTALSNTANRSASFASSGFPRNTEVVPPSNGNRRVDFNRTKSIQIFLQRQEQLLTHDPTLQQLEASLKLQDHIYDQIATQKRILEALNPNLRNEGGQYDHVIRQATVQTAQKNRILKLLAKKRAEIGHTNNYHSNTNATPERVGSNVPIGHGRGDNPAQNLRAPAQASQSFSPPATVLGQQDEHSRHPSFNGLNTVSASTQPGQIQSQVQHSFNSHNLPSIPNSNDRDQSSPQLNQRGPSAHTLQGEQQSQPQEALRNGISPQVLNPSQDTTEMPNLVLPSWSNNNLLKSSGSSNAPPPTNVYNSTEAQSNNQDQSEQNQTKGLLGISVHTSIFDKTPSHGPNSSLKETRTQNPSPSSGNVRLAEGVPDATNKRLKTVVDLTLSDEDNDGQ